MTKLNTIKLKPTTNGVRHQLNLVKSVLIQNPEVIKNIREKKYSAFGRGRNLAKITVRHKHRGVKRLYRNIKYGNQNAQSLIIGMCYDPNRTALSTINFDFSKGSFFYGLCPSDVYPGTLVQTIGAKTVLRAGYRTKLGNLPSGTIIHNVGLEKKGIYAKAAGTQVVVVNADSELIKVRLPSGKIVELLREYYGTVGKVSNGKHYLTFTGKAGRNVHKGKRPTVRGIAMNPVDHPHGGRTNGGRPSVTPWGLPTKCGFKLKRRKKIKH